MNEITIRTDDSWMFELGVMSSKISKQFIRLSNYHVIDPGDGKKAVKMEFNPDSSFSKKLWIPKSLLRIANNKELWVKNWFARKNL